MATVHKIDDDAQRKKLHEEFLRRPRPKDSDEAFEALWLENVELRRKIVMCQIEYEKAQEYGREMYRQYAGKCREIEAVKSKAETQVKVAEKRLAEAQKARRENFEAWWALREKYEPRPAPKKRGRPKKAKKD